MKDAPAHGKEIRWSLKYFQLKKFCDLLEHQATFI